MMSSTLLKPRLPGLCAASPGRRGVLRQGTPPSRFATLPPAASSAAASAGEPPQPLGWPLGGATGQGASPSSSSSSPAGGPSDAASTTPGNSSSSTPEACEAAATPGLLARLKRVFLGERLTKQRLAELGMGAVASYGFLSNLVYCSGMAVTWIMFVQQRGVSPLAAGQWPAYLAFYAGFWTINNFIRPFRFAIAVAAAPAFDRALEGLAARTRLSKRGAFGVYLGLLGGTTCVLTFGSIGLFAGPQAFAR